MSSTTVGITDDALVETERLWLRPFVDDDVTEYAAIAAKPEVTRFLGTGDPTPTGMSVARAQRWIDAWREAEADGLGVFAVVEKSTGKLIGHCGFSRLPDGRVEIDYAFDTSAWGKGYGTEAARAMVEYGSMQLGLKEFIGMAYPENYGSIGIFRKLGMVPLGSGFHHGSDLVIFSWLHYD